MELIAKNPSISALEIASAIGLKRRVVEKNISQLKKEGRLHRIGPDKGGTWDIQNTNH